MKVQPECYAYVYPLVGLHPKLVLAAGYYHLLFVVIFTRKYIYGNVINYLILMCKPK